MRYLTLKEALELHRRIIQQSGGSDGIRDFGLLESALVQPLMTLGEEDLYPTLVDKAAAMCFSLVQNHPFLDGNKRVGHAAMEIFLILNGYEIHALASEQEEVILSLAVGKLKREAFRDWLRAHVVERIES